VWLEKDETAGMVSGRTHFPGGNAPSGRNGQAGSTNTTGNRMSQMDADKDGSVSFEEMCAQVKNQRPADFNEDRMRKRFDSIDTNHDGKLSAQELEKAPQPQRK
jgi:Ca2+-binding EF-hand superfamily protein